jgi:hypothetical protein
MNANGLLYLLQLLDAFLSLLPTHRVFLIHCRLTVSVFGRIVGILGFDYIEEFETGRMNSERLLACS